MLTLIYPHLWIGSPFMPWRHLEALGGYGINANSLHIPVATHWMYQQQGIFLQLRGLQESC